MISRSRPMKIVVVCVNYFCEVPITKMLQTINMSGSYALSVILVDNSHSMPASPSYAQIAENPAVKLLDPGGNLGYLGAFAWAVRTQSLDDAYDIVILANPDLEFSQDFFATLAAADYDESIAIIAPDIVNLPSLSHANPAMARRPNRRLMWLRKVVHSNKQVYRAYDLVHRLKKRLRVRTSAPQVDQARIYAPHGALMLFRAEYFEAGGSLDYFSFLFGEEIFVAEEARRIGKSVLFDPNLQARHHEHVATGVLGTSKLSEFSHKSLARIYDKYFKHEH